MTVAVPIAPPAPSGRLAHVVAIVRGYRFRYANEIELQDGLAKAFAAAGLAFAREVRLTARDRIDFLVDDVGVEVKIKGGPSAVVAQLGRYSRCPQIGALVLVTDRAQLTRVHRANAINGKPFAAVALLGGIV